MRRNWLERVLAVTMFAVALVVGADQAMAQDTEPMTLGQKYKTALNRYEQGDYAGAKKLLLEVKDTVEKENLQLNPATKLEIDRRLTDIDVRLQGAATETPKAEAPVVEAPKVDTALRTRIDAAAGKYNKAQGLMRAKDYESALVLFNEAKFDVDALPADKVAVGDRRALESNIAACKEQIALANAPARAADARDTMTVADARTTTKPRETVVAETDAGPAATDSAAVLPAAPAGGADAAQESVFKDAVDADRVRVQLEDQEIRTKLADGMVFMRERDFKRAEGKFLAAQLQVKYGDFDAAFKTSRLAEIQRHLDLVAAARAQGTVEDMKRQNEEQAEIIRQENQRRKEEQLKLKVRLAEQFDTFYTRGQYDDALVILERMKALDPEDASIKEKIKTTMQKKIQMWQYEGKVNRVTEEAKQRAAAEEEMTAWYPITRYPDNWKELSDRRLRAMERTSIQERPQDRAVRQKLEETVVSFTFNEQPVMEAIDFLQTLGKVNIVPDRSKFDDPAKTVTLKLENVPLETAIRLLTEQLGMKWVIRDGVVFISNDEGVKRPPETNTYDVRDLLADIPNFTGPTFELQNISGGRGGSGGSGGGSGSSIFSDTSGTGTGGAEEEQTKSAEESLTDLIDLVKQVIESGTWEDGSGNAIRGRAGSIIVTHTPDAQQKVQKLLEDLRETRALQVAIDIRFITVTDNFLESVGFDFTGAGNTAASAPHYIDSDADGVPDTSMGVEFDRTIMGGEVTFLGGLVNGLGGVAGLGTAKGLNPATGGLTLMTSFLDDVEVNFILTAVQQSSRATLMNAPKLTMMNGQRAYIAVSKQQNFVQDVTVQVSEGAVGYDPDIGTVQDGIVFDVRPTVSADRRYVQMDLRPSVAVIERIDNFQTITTGVFGGAVIQLPVISVTVVRTTVSVPDGGTLLIGGLSYAFDQEEDSGIPILSKIPIIGKLFTRRGFTTERQNVVILVKPTIIIQEEREAEIQ